MPEFSLFFQVQFTKDRKNSFLAESVLKINYGSNILMKQCRHNYFFLFEKSLYVQEWAKNLHC